MKILYFAPFSIYPAASGFHRRQLEILSGLKYLNCNTLLVSSVFKPNQSWSENAIGYLESNIVEAVHIYQSNPWDRMIWRFSKYHRVLHPYLPTLSAILTPPGQRAWFRNLIFEFSPDLIWMNYAYSDGLIDHNKFSHITRAIDIHDLISINRKMWRAVSSLHQPSSYISAETVDDRLLDEEFFSRQNFKADSWEYKIYDQYSHTISINLKETELLKQNTRHTQVIDIPMTIELSHTISDYVGPAIFPTGDNPYNTQAYFYFIKKILPKILKESKDFSLEVTGYCSPERVSSTRGVTLRGYVPDIANAYTTARFLVCPIFGGTGQLVKVIEAMSYGLPAVILRQAAVRTPIQHEYNGFIAENAQEFAEYTLRLWKDRELCRKMGQAARNTIAAGFIKAQLYHGLNQILSAGKSN